MKRTTKIILLLIALVTGILIARIPRSSPQSPLPPETSVKGGQFETQNNEGGNVTVSVTPLSLKPGLPASFDVAFETHSVDLNFDVEKIATLNDGSRAVYTPYWDGSPPGGHHRNGTLRFTPDLPAQASLTKTNTLTLTFTGVAGISERTFSWEVKQ